jgi:hypothetical protein
MKFVWVESAGNQRHTILPGTIISNQVLLVLWAFSNNMIRLADDFFFDVDSLSRKLVVVPLVEFADVPQRVEGYDERNLKQFFYFRCGHR